MSKPATVRHATLVGACAAALALAGCTANSSEKVASSRETTGEQSRILKLTEQMSEMVNTRVKSPKSEQIKDDQKDAKELCTGVLSPRLVKQLEKQGGCEKLATTALLSSDPAPFEIVVGSVKVSGDTATAKNKIVIGKKSRTDTLKFVLDSKHWTFDGVEKGATVKEK